MTANSKRRLRVALDARRLQDRPLRGVGRALDNILEHLAAEVELVLLTDARQPSVPTDLEQHALVPPPRAPGAVWLQFNVARWLRGFDGIFHGTFSALPYVLPVPAAVTIYDLSFELHSEDFRATKRWVFRRQARHAARSARSIITGSEFARQQLVMRYRVPPDKILVAPLSVDPVFRPENAANARRVLDSLGVRDRYLVALGGARRRGLETAISAWRRVHRETLDIDLVIVGPDRPPSEPGLFRAGVLSDDQWAAVLAGADAFCYPTRFEGFGFPALEALASGTPVVCAPVGPLPETLLDAAAWCEAPTEGAVGRVLHRVLTDGGYATELRRRGLEVARNRPSWKESAAEVLRAYRRTASGQVPDRAP